MTEAEWLTTIDAERMVRFLRFGTAGRYRAGFAWLVGRWNATRDQKLLAFVWLCLHRARRAPHEWTHSAFLHAAVAPVAVVRWSCEVARERAEAERDEVATVISAPAYTPARSGDGIDSPPSAEMRHRWRVLAAVRNEAALQCAHLRDLFGNPFRAVAYAPEWRTDTAVALARQMYDADEFGAMPILADALQDAGCDSDDILDHCRTPGPHVRGCWVCDLVLGKE